MNIVVTGSNGQVGRECVALGALGLTRTELDLSSPDQLPVLRALKPGAVINCAAYTAVDKAENDAAAAYQVNRDGAAQIAKICAELGVPLIHLSTDYVFDGQKQTAYVESDLPNPSGVYAHSKWAGEEAVRQVCPRHVILRVSWVFGQHGSNFVKTILRLARERPELRVVADQHGCPTHAGAIAETAMAIARKATTSSFDAWGLYHYSGSGATTWHSFAQAIIVEAARRKLISRELPVKPITSQDYPTAARRPANSVLDCSLIGQRLGIRPKPWLEGLRLTLQQLNF